MRPAREDEGAPGKLVERRPQLAPELLAQAGVDDNVDGRVENEAEVPDLESYEQPNGRLHHSLKVVQNLHHFHNNIRNLGSNKIEKN